MPERVDVLIVGGGIQGVTALIEAGRRGLSALLVERADFGSGASSNSMKIAHGGLRYLQSLDLARSTESVRERRRWLRLAPDLVRPLPFRMDLGGRSGLYRLAFRIGLRANDVLTAHRNDGVRDDARLPDSRHPIWYDAFVTDTERLLFDVLYTATTRFGDRVSARNYTSIVETERAAGRVAAVRLDDGTRVETPCVLSCVGAHRRSSSPILSMNLCVPRLELVADGVGIGMRHPTDGRNVFAVPWRDVTIVGTINRPYPFPPEEPFRLEPSRIDEVLAWLRLVHPELAALDRRDVRFVHAGILPGGGRGDDPSDDASVEDAGDGRVEVSGVKWTTAWAVSERALDLVCRRLGHRGAADPVIDLVDVHEARQAAVGPAAAGPDEDPSPADLRFLVDSLWARTLSDVLLRRLPIATTGHPGRARVEAIARDLAACRGWSDAAREAEIAAFDAEPRFAGNTGDPAAASHP